MENRPLLDVQLQVAMYLPGLTHALCDPVQIASDSPEMLGHRHSLRVDGDVIALLPEACHGPAAEEPAIEAGPLFVGEHQDFQGMLGGYIRVAKGLDHLDGCQAPQGPIVLASVGNGIDMGAQGDGKQVGIRSRTPSKDVARSIDADLQTSLLHQPDCEGAALHILGGEGDPLHTGRAVSYASKLLQPRVQTRCVYAGVGHF